MDNKSLYDHKDVKSDVKRSDKLKMYPLLDTYSAKDYLTNPELKANAFYRKRDFSKPKYIEQGYYWDLYMEEWRRRLTITLRGYDSKDENHAAYLYTREQYFDDDMIKIAQTTKNPILRRYGDYQPDFDYVGDIANWDNLNGIVLSAYSALNREESDLMAYVALRNMGSVSPNNDLEYILELGERGHSNSSISFSNQSLRSITKQQQQHHKKQHTQ